MYCLLVFLLTPVRFTSRPPHLGHRPGIATTSGLVKVHSGQPGQAKNRPNRPIFTTIFRPHRSHTSSDSSSGTLMRSPSNSDSAFFSSASKPV